jgi:hypothetical protein
MEARLIGPLMVGTSSAWRLSADSNSRRGPLMSVLGGCATDATNGFRYQFCYQSGFLPLTAS